MSDILTTATKSYMTTFQGYEQQFMQWGSSLFFGVLTINLVMAMVWVAFDKGSLPEAMSSFLKKLFVSSVFYTILLHPEWAHSVLDGAKEMGKKLGGNPLDPSNIVSQGIGMANQVLAPIKEMAIWKMGFGAIIGTLVYLSLLYVFGRIALDVALAIVMTGALITTSCFFLGFGGFSVTQAIARQSIDAVIGYCVKLLGYYMVISAGLDTLDILKAGIPATPDAVKSVGFDDYAWLLVGAWLFYVIARNLPEQMAKIVCSGIQESRGTDVAAMALSAVRLATQSMAPQKGSPAAVAGKAAKGLAKIAAGGAGYVATKMGLKAAGKASSLSSDGSASSDIPASGGGKGPESTTSAESKPHSVPKT